jgi:cob(I)alamin adenosyltransferase
MLNVSLAVWGRAGRPSDLGSPGYPNPVRIYTKTGDEGTTGLLYGGRISKADPAAEAYGSVDEAVAALGMARALIPDRDTAELVLKLQRDLFVVAADLATNPRERGKLKPGVSLATRDMSEGLEPLI